MTNTLKAIFIVLIFVGGGIGAIIFHETEPRISIICVGAIFFLIGLFVLFSQKPSMKNAPILLFPIAGALMIFIPAMLMIAENSDALEDEFVEKLSVNCCVSVFALVGIGLVVFPAIIHKTKMKTFTIPIEAVCIHLDRHVSRSRKGGTTITYAPSWEYEYNGNIHIYKESTYTNLGVPKIGAVYQLLMDPNKPEELYRPVRAVRIMLYVMGALFAFIGIFALVMYNSNF